MNSIEDTPGWEDIARTWGGFFTFSFDPKEHVDEPYGAVRKDGQGELWAATHSDLLDRIKDDLTAKPFGSPVPEARAEDRL